MRFQNKMFITYTTFILLVSIIIAFAYSGYSVARYRKTEEQSLAVVAQQVSNQMDELIKPMDTRTRYLLSDPEILESIRFLASPPAGEANAGYVEEARAIIQAGLSIDYVMNDFYRVIFFNPSGDIIYSRSRPPMVTGIVSEMEVMPWLERAVDAKGHPVLVSAHEDSWGVRNRPQVFSLVRAIQGSGMGYIEVQRTIENVGEAITLPKENLSVLIFVNDGELLYAGDDIQNPVDYWNTYLENSESPVFQTRIEGESQLIAVDRSAYDVTVMIIESMNDVRKGSNSVAFITILIAMIFCMISLAFVWLSSRYLTKPLRQLRGVMEATRLENLSQEITVTMPNDELEALNFSYKNVLERLREAILKEKQASILQLQAQFDLLQAQVNPHFLYNVLNVIAQHGMRDGDEEICDMCASLAAMLRYSTNTKQRHATIAQELEYLQQYFYLLKSRYKHKLSVTIEVEPEINGQVIPKIALQQIVENCINHGFANTTEHMQITVEGWREGDKWIVRIRDNGQGFCPDKLKEINAQLEATRRRIAQERSSMELEIGGMGLINTYARFYLMFDESLSFTLNNYEEGAEVVIGADWRKEDADVSGDDCG